MPVPSDGAPIAGRPAAVRAGGGGGALTTAPEASRPTVASGAIPVAPTDADAGTTRRISIAPEAAAAAVTAALDTKGGRLVRPTARGAATGARIRASGDAGVSEPAPATRGTPVPDAGRGEGYP